LAQPCGGISIRQPATSIWWVEFDSAHAGSPLHRYFDLKRDLESLLGRPVDLVELRARPNTRLKRSIERAKMPLYETTARLFHRTWATCAPKNSPLRQLL
jgi:hypothetical protein